MNNKIYSIQGQNFSLLPNDLNLLNKAAPMIAMLRKLSYEYTKDLDLSEANEYKLRISEISEAKVQMEDILSEGVDENGVELSSEKITEMYGRIDELQNKYDEITEELKQNTVVQNMLRLKEELESYALIELLTDISFLKPILKKILKGGDIDKIDFSNNETIGFIKDVVTDFFTVMNRSSLKL